MEKNFVLKHILITSLNDGKLASFTKSLINKMNKEEMLQVIQNNAYAKKLLATYRTSEKTKQTCFERKQYIPPSHYVLSKSCVPSKCVKGLQFGKELGSGAFGQVLDACYNGDCNYVVKIIDLEVKITSLYSSVVKEAGEVFTFEAEITKMASDLGVGPKFIKATICKLDQDDKPVGIIVMQKLTTTLDSYLKENPEYRKTDHLINFLKTEIRPKIQRLHENGIVHADMKKDNIMITLDKNGLPKQAFIIDYGASIYLEEDAFGKNFSQIIGGIKKADLDLTDDDDWDFDNNTIWNLMEL